MLGSLLRDHFRAVLFHRMRHRSLLPRVSLPIWWWLSESPAMAMDRPIICFIGDCQTGPGAVLCSERSLPRKSRPLGCSCFLLTCHKQAWTPWRQLQVTLKSGALGKAEPRFSSRHPTFLSSRTGAARAKVPAPFPLPGSLLLVPVCSGLSLP